MSKNKDEKNAGASTNKRVCENLTFQLNEIKCPLTTDYLLFNRSLITV